MLWNRAMQWPSSRLKNIPYGACTFIKQISLVTTLPSPICSVSSVILHISFQKIIASILEGGLDTRNTLQQGLVD